MFQFLIVNILSFGFRAPPIPPNQFTAIRYQGINGGGEYTFFLLGWIFSKLNLPSNFDLSILSHSELINSGIWIFPVWISSFQINGSVMRRQLIVRGGPIQNILWMFPKIGPTVYIGHVYPTIILHFLNFLCSMYCCICMHCGFIKSKIYAHYRIFLILISSSILLTDSTGNSPNSSRSPSRESSLTSRIPSREPSVTSPSHVPYRNNSGGSLSLSSLY